MQDENNSHQRSILPQPIIPTDRGSLRMAYLQRWQGEFKAMKSVLIVFMAASVIGVPQAAAPTPEQVTAKVLEGYKTRDYGMTVEAYDPTELRSFADDLKVVFKDRSNTPNAMRPVVFGPELSSDRLLLLKDNDLVSRYLAGYMEMMSKRSGVAPVQISEYKVIGHVIETPELAHVVARVTVKDASFSVTAIRPFTVKRVGGEWRAQLDESAKALLTKLRADASR